MAVTVPHILIAMAISAAAAWLLGFPAAWLGRRLRIIDNPKHRSSHTVPTPRTGGMSILFGALAGTCLSFQATAAFLLVSAVGALVAIISFVDDLLDIPSLPRLLVHVVMTALAVYVIGLPLVELGLPYLHFELPYAAGLALSILFVVAFINFYNFMDGINGLAASQGIIGGLAISGLLLIGGAKNSVITAAALAGGCLGFLPHNFPKAKMFMGDLASTTIGFGLAMLTLVGACRTQIPWVAMLMPLGVFIYDATFTLFKRILHGENFLKPHRQHHYQLLIRCGWSHPRVTLLQAGLMVICSLAGFLYAQSGDAVRLAVLLGLVVMFVAYSVCVHRYFARHRTDSPSEAAVSPEAPAPAEPGVSA